eukprot:403367114
MRRTSFLKGFQKNNHEYFADENHNPNPNQTQLSNYNTYKNLSSFNKNIHPSGSSTQNLNKTYTQGKQNINHSNLNNHTSFNDNHSVDRERSVDEESQARATSLSFYRRFKRVNERMKEQKSLCQNNDTLDNISHYDNNNENYSRKPNKTTMNKLGKINIENIETKSAEEGFGGDLENYELQTNCSYMQGTAKTPNSVSNHIQNILFKREMNSQNHNNSQNYHFSSNHMDLQSSRSQLPPQPQIKNREKYNIFTEDQEMRRMALMSSSNKKRRGSSQKKKRYGGQYQQQRVNNFDLSPASSQSGLFINGLGDQLTESQCRDFEKKANIQKTNYSSIKQQQQYEQMRQNKLREAKKKSSNLTNSSRHDNKFIKIDNLTTTSPLSNNKTMIRCEDSSDAEEERDLIKAASTHHNRSISGTRSTPSKGFREQQRANGQQQPNAKIQQFLFLGTESTLTPSNGLNMSHLNINSTKCQNQGQIQDSLLEDSHTRGYYQSKTNATGTHQPSPISYQIQKSLHMLNQNNAFTEDNSMTMDHQSPSISYKQNNNITNLSNPLLDQSSFILTQQQATTIRKKMEKLAKELADSEEIGLDENTLMRMFELKTEKLVNMSTINNQFTFEDNLNNQSSISRSQQINDQNSQNNRAMNIEDQSSSIANSQYNQRNNSRFQRGQNVDTFLTDPTIQEGLYYVNATPNMFGQNQRQSSNVTLTPRSHKSNSAKFNDHFQYTEDERNLMNHRSNNHSKEFRETFAIKDLQSLTKPYILGQSEEGGLQISNATGGQHDLNHSQFTQNDGRLSQSHLRNNQTYSGYRGGGDSTVVITNHNGNEESRFCGNNQFIDDSIIGSHLIKSGSIEQKQTRKSQSRSLKSSQLQRKSELQNSSKNQSRKISAEKRKSTISRSSSKKRYSSVKSKFMDHFKTQQTLAQEKVSLVPENQLQNSKHNHSSILVDPFVNDQLISLNDQFATNNQTSIQVGPSHFENITSQQLSYMQKNTQGSQNQQQLPQSIHQHDFSKQQYNTSQDAQNQRQQSITPAFAESINLHIKPQSHTQSYQINQRQRSSSQDKQVTKRIVKQKSKSLLNQPSNKKSQTAQQNIKQSVTPNEKQMRLNMASSIYNTNMSHHSQAQFRDTLYTQQSRQTYHQNSQQRSNSKLNRKPKSLTKESRSASQNSRLKNSTYKQFILKTNKNSTSSPQNLKFSSNLQLKNQTSSTNVQQAPRCKCLQKLQITKETIKQALKVKYEARLKEMKSQFEQKFKRNEITWKNRLECHKQSLQKEQMKNLELQAVIEEMTSRISQVERKNKEMFNMIRQSQKQTQSNPSLNQQDTSITQHNSSQNLDPNIRDNQTTQQQQQRRNGSKLAQRAYNQKYEQNSNQQQLCMKSQIPTAQLVHENFNNQEQFSSMGFVIQNQEHENQQYHSVSCRPQQKCNNSYNKRGISSSSSSEEDEFTTSQKKRSIVGNEDKLKRIEKILYKK